MHNVCSNTWIANQQAVTPGHGPESDRFLEKKIYIYIYTEVILPPFPPLWEYVFFLYKLLDIFTSLKLQLRAREKRTSYRFVLSP